ncbi:MAG: protein translocase subunit SecD [bacterium]
MRRKNVFRSIIILLASLLSVLALYPTFQLSQLKKRAEDHYLAIEQNTTLTRNDITAALKSTNLELTARDNFAATNGNTLDDILDDVKSLDELFVKIEQNEEKSIKLGLDLQGGSYLVYEVNLPQLLRENAKVVDDKFETALNKTVEKAQSTNDPFFDVLTTVFQEQNLRLSRYFGRPRDEDTKIVSDLTAKAEDAINQILEVLRNRIDQFGVSEPSITKQGSQRIVIELAGIEDVDRAKAIIGTTALLEFQLEREPAVISTVRAEINRIMKKQLAAQSGETADDSTQLAATDTSVVNAKLREDTSVSFEEAFGLSSSQESSSDDSVLIDKGVFAERPFDALLADFGGDMAVPTKNRKQVERILNSPEVQAVIPKDSEFLFLSTPVTAPDGQDYYRLYMLKKEPELRGAMIENADSDIGSGMDVGRWVVNFELNGEGARIFSRVTGANVGRRMAIVLDDKVVSIPSIRNKIPNGRAQITGMANNEEAKDLAIVLRAGNLQAPIEVIEERTVGPSLGEDSINKGVFSALLGGAFVLVFMVFYYKMSGLVADLALFLNLLVIMAVLAGFHFTLTLPGVAGIILTIGMAVDANVLIFERIREELRSGKTVRAAIDSGYSRAFKTILDANITTLLTALVLYQFGTGPIKGFALTLSIGILISMFTAIVVTRVIFDYFTDRATITKLSI